MTDDALREKAREWLEASSLCCVGVDHDEYGMELSAEKCPACVDALTTLLAATVAESVGECVAIVKASRGCPPIPKDNMLLAMKHLTDRPATLTKEARP